jgi:hypothetical protein
VCVWYLTQNLLFINHSFCELSFLKHYGSIVRLCHSFFFIKSLHAPYRLACYSSKLLVYLSRTCLHATEFLSCQRFFMFVTLYVHYTWLNCIPNLRQCMLKSLVSSPQSFVPFLLCCVHLFFIYNIYVQLCTQNVLDIDRSILFCCTFLCSLNCWVLFFRRVSFGLCWESFAIYFGLWSWESVPGFWKN